MKKRLFGLLAAIAVIAFAFTPMIATPADPAPALPALMQDAPTEAPSIDPTTLEAILVILTGGVVTLLTQLLKNWLKVEGILAKVLTGAIGVAVVFVYFLIINPPFEILKALLYSAVIFGESTGWYHLYQKRT